MILTPANIQEADFRAGTIILVDKPSGWTSFDVVNKVRYAIRHKLGVKKIKVGHSGTLDPMATGLLILCTGKFTKKLHDLTGYDKSYDGTITLGATTASYDAELPPENEKPVGDISKEQVESIRQNFLGEFEQFPPIYSAIKKDGVAAYKIARKGGEIKMESRPVRVDALEMLEIDLPQLNFSVRCGKGFYVRSLAHDFGQKLGCGGYLSALRRTSIGDYRIEDAWNMDTLIKAIQEDT